MTRGTVTFVFDDGYMAVWQNIVPLLQKTQVPGVFAICIDGENIESTEDLSVQSWSEWLTLKDSGHEIAAHTLTHCNLTEISDQALDRELREPHERLGATTVVYPGGSNNERVRQAARYYYQAGRTVNSGFETVPPKNAFELKSFNYSRRNWSLAKANARVVWAMLANSWIIETYHMLSDSEVNLMHHVPLREFKRHLSFINNLPVSVKTIQDVVSNMN